MPRVLHIVDSWMARLLRWGVVASVVGCLVFLTLGVVGRPVNALNISGSHEIVEVLFAWGTFLGAALLWREGALLRVEFVPLLLPRRLAWCLDAATELGMLAFAALLVVYGWDLATGIQEQTPFLKADKFYWYLSIPTCGAIMAGYSLAALYRLARHPLDGRRAVARQQEIL